MAAPDTGLMLHRALSALALLAVVLGVAVPFGLWTFEHDARTVVIGAHTTTVSPTFDSYATFDFGPLFPRARIPTSQPAGLGVYIDVGETDASDINELIVRDAVIASQPRGEIAKVASTVKSMAAAAAMRGIGLGLLTALVVGSTWSAIGARRRAEIGHYLVRRARHPNRKAVLLGVACGTSLAVGVGLLAWPQDSEPESALQTEGWEPLTSVYPGIGNEAPILKKIELAKGSATQAGLAVVDSAIQTYQTSVQFYGKMRDRVATVADEIRQPADDETVAILVTDRHDNIGMDPVAEAIADAGQASIVIDMGDDTSTGGSWEAFSINSLGKAFEDYDKIGIAGNHDTGGFVVGALEDKGFTVLDGEPVEMDGIRFLGDSDPRSSGLTAGYRGTTGETIEEQGARLTEVACEDGDVSTVVVHSPTTGEQVAKSGCVDLVVSGHLHRQVGPNTLTAPDGRKTVTFTNASTGGAVYAFALGSKLRRPAQVTLVTYRDGRPVGLQPVDFETSGEVSVQDYIALKLRTEADRGPQPQKS